jgi:hypothetical protein
MGERIGRIHPPGNNLFERKKGVNAVVQEDIPPCLILIDKEGRWFYKGLEMVRREIILLFYQHMEMDPRGRYLIHLAGQKCYVDVEDTPFVVWKAALQGREQGHERFLIWLSDDTQETLNLDTLHVGEENVLYCRVKDGRFPARFRRAAYYQLAEYIDEEQGEYYVVLHGRKHTIRLLG